MLSHVIPSACVFGFLQLYHVAGCETSTQHSHRTQSNFINPTEKQQYFHSNNIFFINLQSSRETVFAAVSKADCMYQCDC